MGRDGVLIIGQVGSVGGTHFHHGGTGAGHDVWHAKCATNFYQLTSRHNDFSPSGQCGNGEQYGRSIVVDHGCCLSTSDVTYQPFHNTVSVATPASVQVVFQIERVLHHGVHIVNGHLWQHGAAHVGVDDRACQVQHGAKAGRHFCSDPLGQLLLQTEPYVVCATAQ